MGLRPPKVMKNSFCSATTLNGSAALPFVISTGAPKERSGEICGVSGPSLGMFFDRAKRSGGTCGNLAANCNLQLLWIPFDWDLIP
jgi:hypothetical protein